MADKRVDPDAIRELAKKISADDGPAAFLRNAAKKLDSVKLSGGALTFMGSSTVQAHNDAAEKHRHNVATGVEHLQKVAEALRTVAANWEKSDQPWVVK
jgi:uncharacterized protein YukE